MMKNLILCDMVKRHGGITAVAKELDVMPITLTRWMRKEGSLQVGGKGRGGIGVKKALWISRKLMRMAGRSIKEIFPGFCSDSFFPEEQPKEYTNIDTWQFEDLEWRHSGWSQEDVDDELDRHIIKEELERVMSRCLNRKRLEIMKLRFGLFGSRMHTQKEVADLCGLTTSRIGQIEDKARIKIKNCIKSDSKMLRDIYLIDQIRYVGYFVGDIFITKRAINEPHRF